MTIITGLTAARMLEIEAASIVDGNIVGNDLILTNHGGQTINAGNVRGIQGLPGPIGRNRIINGDLAVDQRAYMTPANVFGSFVADRWLLECGAAFNQLSLLPNTWVDFLDVFPRFIRITSSSHTTSSQYTALVQKIEGVRTFAGQTVTVSFEARSPDGGTPSIAVEFEQNFGSVGSSSVYIPAGKVSITSTPQRYSLTVAIPDLSNKTIDSDPPPPNDHLAVRFFTSAGSNFNARTTNLGLQNIVIDITGIQIEEGAVATAFDHRPYAENLRLCQRYYYRNSLAGLALNFPSYTSGCIASWVLAHPTTLRAVGTPISSVTNISYANASSFSWGAQSTTFGRLILASTATSTNCTATFAAGNYVGVDAEF